MNKYKLVRGYSPDDLEKNVNFWLSLAAHKHFVLVGPPQMFGHSEYFQALELQSIEVITCDH